MRGWATFFLVANVFLLLLGLAVAGLAIWERATLNLFSESWVVIGCVAALLLAAAIGTAGILRLRQDMQHDVDGKETVAQNLIECYFWIVLSVSAVLFTASIVYLSLTQYDDEDDFAEIAAKDPGRFEELADARGVDTDDRDCVTQTSDRVLFLRTTAASCSLALSICLLPVLYAAAKIVTWYEIVQGALRYLAALFVALALGIIYLACIGLVIISLEDLDLQWVVDGVNVRALVIACFVCFLVLGCLLVPLSVLGFLAGHREDTRLLTVFQVAAAATAASSSSSSTSSSTSSTTSSSTSTAHRPPPTTTAAIAATRHHRSPPQFFAPIFALFFVVVSILAAVTGATRPPPHLLFTPRLPPSAQTSCRLAAGATELGPFIDHNCRAMVQYGDSDFFKASVT